MFNLISLATTPTLTRPTYLTNIRVEHKHIAIVMSLLGLIVTVLVPNLLYAAEGDPATAKPQMPPMEVGVVSMAKQTVPRISTIPGRAVAYQQVNIRPRVNGVIQTILYKEGKVVAEGDPLFQLDDAIYLAQVAADEASVSTAKANLNVANATYKRAFNLKGSGFTVADVEQAKATLDNAHATLGASKAALNYSKTQLSWTTIKSPINGVTDVAAVSVGDLVVSGQSDALTVVTRLDPIDVDMLVPSANILSVRSQIKAGTLTVNEKIKATLTLENAEIYETTGTLLVPGSIVSTTTGTVPMRFRFDNPDRKILPGMFLRGDVEIGDIQAFLVPQRAAKRQYTGQLSAFIVGLSLIHI
ncbi:MAG TPA: efflux RND transporter periplasmic adaptor subunit, partial [Methylophaga sp.]|nr:efflux RND transporter periplasmic adaptor subunit [Methylophaga sp.]